MCLLVSVVKKLHFIPGKPHHHLYLFIKAVMCLKVIKDSPFLISKWGQGYLFKFTSHCNSTVSCYTVCFSTGFLSLLSMFCVYKGPYARVQEGVETHWSILTWRIPWAEEAGRLQSMGSQRVGHDWATFTFQWKIKIYTIPGVIFFRVDMSSKSRSWPDFLKHYDAFTNVHCNFSWL